MQSKKRMTKHPATRALAVLELLQTHRRLSGAELASRIEVDRRTVRRYIALLEEIGIPITTERGPHGGYELVAGYKLPPMMFTNDEALALSLGLAAVRGFGLTEATPAIEGAQAKLERVMPANLKGRIRAVAESVAFAPFQQRNAGDDAGFATLSAATHKRIGVRLRYCDQAGRSTERDFDPYGLAFSGGRWYAVGLCHLRKGLRNFRLDRIENITEQARPFERPAGFDVLVYLTTSIATLPRAFSIEVLLETDLDSARRELFPAIGVLEPVGDALLLRSQADDLDWFARELARLPWRFEIRNPAGLVEAVSRHANLLLAIADPEPEQGGQRP
jgi:predicted DNA-binding transcriptional regulator YafY